MGSEPPGLCGLAVQAGLCSDALQALRVEQEWAANQVCFEEYRQKEEKRKQEEVRPDFAVCCAIVTVRRDYLAASQKLRREQERAGALPRRVASESWEAK